MKTREEIENIIPNTGYGLSYNYDDGFIDGYTKCQEDMGDVILDELEKYTLEYEKDMADVIKQAIEYGYQLRCNNKPINSGIDWVKEFNSLNKQD